jgi:transcriptional regulator with XRE-family HTH domain
MQSPPVVIPARAIGRAQVTQALPTVAKPHPFAAYFKSLLDENRITIARLSSETGLDKSTFSNWLSGKSVPRAEMLRLIAPHVNRLHGELLVAAEHSTPEELGMTGAPSVKLPKQVEDLVRTVTSRAIEDDDRAALLGAIETIHDLFYRNVARRPARSRR